MNSIHRGYPFIPVFLLMLLAPSVLADEATLPMDRLWLPKSYGQYWANLRQVAEQKTATETCVKLIRAELVTGESTLDAPVFAVLCRDNAGKTFVEKFDGITLLSKNPVIETEPAEEIPMDVSEVTDMKAAVYQRCVELWENDIALMKSMQWLDDLADGNAQQQLDTDQGRQYSFVRGFNAKNSSGRLLKYSAQCTGSNAVDAQSTIQIRRE